ncbi:MAG: ubiquinone/menaquinone biosynthesis methyltransferase [Vicinamibacterales bacterium]
MSLRRAFDTPETKRRYNRQLFATIADRYDLITAVLSYGQDARWKRRLVAEAAITPHDRALDLACGTGDIAFAVAARGARTVGLDLTFRMLALAGQKQAALVPGEQHPGAGIASRQQLRPVRFIQGDMTWLPFVASSFDVVTTGYGLRNVPDLRAAIAEIGRVLKPGGRFLSLDFNRPQSAIIRSAYLSYLGVVGSVLGFILHRDPDTYRYIAASLQRYPGAAGVAGLLAAGGFTNVRVVPLLGGLMSLHLAELPR